MIELSQEVLDAIEKTMPICVATASLEGTPNLIYVTYVKALDKQTLILADNKFDKTRKNLDSNPQISVTVLDPDTHKSYQIKCATECVTQGKRFDDIVNWVHVNHPQLNPKAGFYLTVKEVYCGAVKIS